MDDTIVTYDCKNGLKQNKSKTFSGHSNQGYGCGLSFSPDGQYIASGDAEGKMWFWNFKTGKNFRTLKVHEGVCIDLDWHPLDSSKVATCGWDGLVKLWD